VGTLEFFLDENQTIRGGQLFIGSKISKTILKLESLLIVLELTNNSSGLKLMLMKVLSTVIQN
jgi:hypothetical protein